MDEERNSFSSRRILVGNPGNSFGIVGFLIGMIGFTVLIPSIFAVVLGNISRKKSRETKMSETWGKLSAVIGWIGIILIAIIVLGFVIFWLSHTSNTYN